MPRLPNLRISTHSYPPHPPSRAYACSIALPSSFLKRDTGVRSACPGGSSLFGQVCTEHSKWGADGAALVVGQGRLAALPAEAGLFWILDCLARTEELEVVA